MKVSNYINAVRAEADRAHEQAQDEGDPKKYREAAELYERVGDDEAAERCILAATRLEN